MSAVEGGGRPACGAAEVGRRLAEARDGLQETLRAHGAVEQDHRARQGQEEADFKAGRQALEKRQRAALEEHSARSAEEKRAALERLQRRDDRVDAARASCETRVRESLQRESDELKARLQQAEARLSATGPRPGPDGAGASAESAALRTSIASLRASARELQAAIADFAARHGAQLPTTATLPETYREPAADEVEQTVELVAEDLRRTAHRLRSLRKAVWPQLGQKLSVAVLGALAVLLHAAGVGLAFHLGMSPTWRLGAGLSVLLSLGLVGLLAWLSRRSAAGAAARLQAAAAAAVSFLDHLEDRATMEDRITRIMAIDDEVSALMAEKRQAADAALADIHKRHEEISTRLVRERSRRLGELETAHARAAQRLAEEHARELAAQQSEHAARMQRLRDEKEAAVAALAARWRSTLDGLVAFSRGAAAGCRERHPEWRAPGWADWRPPAAFPEDVLAGALRLDLAGLVAGCERGERFPLPAEKMLELPLALGFPDGGSLLIQAGSAMRARALAILFNTALRVLTAFPPGRARLTIVDPVGLGQSFAALMHLSDHDESLVGGRIWTDATHIERRLAELTEHIEKVIQKYLRNRYASIADYNREAGEIKEAYQFLVIADFPTAFDDLALERLASIVNSGAQCGVYTLIFHDATQKLPAMLDDARLRRNGPVLAAEGDAFAVDHEVLRQAAFAAEAPPDGATVARLLDLVGRGAQASKRVEVPFATVAPPPDQVWSASAETGIRVPIGRSGADRHQHLDLGRGTAQHALVGGRTGSGKSTLLHVIVTNTALWFSPDEVEFYLIDFKHGVEFKTFAVNRLPHARVVAIESDREFGLSVLQHINRELGRRGQLFRRCGVQDLASHRQQPGGERLPRMLLLIDEFQEFFTEDDAVARDAALLLDRFVRQGRAFGIHVVLGSQTLSGIYTLAKSTLGQMGVRIALQCNEADSHLILSEDNSAARLLSRPGDAIYNDMSGLVEGNSPFQVVWLPDDVEEAALRGLAVRTEAAGADRTPRSLVVFEGNTPAELAANAALREMLHRPFRPEDAAGRVWLGEPNAIKGPTEAVFAPAGGANLLLIGPHREAAFAMFCSAVIGLAVRHRPKDLRIIVAGGDGRDDEQAERLAALAAAVPGGLERPSGRELPRVIAELGAEAAAAAERGRPSGRRTFLFVFGLQRFPALRPEEDFALSADREDGPPTGERFADLLRDGPAQGVHVVVWCDTLNNLNRALSRKSLREFDLRVLFQMSPADSSELIDSTAAGNLGLHNALLAVQSEGSREKFRPYTVPDERFLEELRGPLRKRFALPPG